MTSLVLGDRVLDLGLNALDTDATHIYICSAMPADYTDATTTKALGYKSLGAGSVFAAPTAGTGTPAGRKAVSAAVVAGTVVSSGTASCWAAVDSVSSRLLASGTMSGGGAVIGGQAWTLASFSIRLPGDISVVSSDAAETTAFLARTSGLDTTHTNAYKTLINTLVANGDFAHMTGLWFPGTQDQTTAKLNLISTSYPLVEKPNGGTLTWTANHGYAGDGTASWVDTGLMPSWSAGNASGGVWVRNARTVQNGSSAIGAGGPSNNGPIRIAPYPAGVQTVWSLRDGTNYESDYPASSQGFWAVRRNLVGGYSTLWLNGLLKNTGTNPDLGGNPTASVGFLAFNDGTNGVSQFSVDEFCMGFIGDGSVNIANVYSAAHVFLQAVGAVA